MRAGRTALAEFGHELLHHAAAKTAALRARQQVDVQMRRIFGVRFRREIIGKMIPGVDVLDACPVGRVAGGFPKFGGELRAPFAFVTIEEFARIECSEGVTTDALRIFKNEAEIGFEFYIWADENAAERVWIFAIEGLAIFAVIAGFQTDVIRAGFVAGSSGANRE